MSENPLSEQARLRELLYQEPSPKVWNELCVLLSSFSEGDDDFQAIIQYTSAHLEHWPDALRMAPTEWIQGKTPKQFKYVDWRHLQSHTGPDFPRWDLLTLCRDPLSTFVCHEHKKAPSLQPTRWRRGVQYDFVYESTPPALEASNEHHKSTIMSIRSAKEIERVATIDYGGHWAVWRDIREKPIYKGELGGLRGYDALISPCGNYLAVIAKVASVAVDSVLYIIHLEDNKVIQKIEDSSTWQVQWSTDASYLLSLEYDKVRAYKVDTGELIHSSLFPAKTPCKKILTQEGTAWIFTHLRLECVRPYIGKGAVVWDGTDAPLQECEDWFSYHFEESEGKCVSVPKGLMAQQADDSLWLTELATRESIAHFRLSGSWPTLISFKATFSQLHPCIFFNIYHRDKEHNNTQMKTAHHFLYNGETGDLMTFSLSGERAEWSSCVMSREGRLYTSVENKLFQVKTT